MSQKLSQERGSALLIVLALMTALSLMAIMSADRATVDIELAYNQLHSEQAFYVADAGIKHGLAILENDFTWRAGFVSEPIGDGFYVLIVTDSTTDSALVDTVVLRANAVVMGSVASIEAYIVPINSNPFKYAAFAEDSIAIRNSSCTDSYNSDSSYVASQLNNSGDIASNGNLFLKGSLTVNGDASTSGGSIIMDGLATVTGDTISSAPIQDINVPESEYTWAESVNNAPAGFTGTYTYDPSTDSLSLTGTQKLVLSGGVYFFSSIFLNNNASIEIAPGEDVTIYLTEGFKLKNVSSFNPGGSPSSLIIYAKGNATEIGNTTEFRGAFLGMNTDLKIDNNTNVYGAFMTKTMQIVNTACIHYDRKLSEFSRPQIEGYQVVAWREL